MAASLNRSLAWRAVLGVRGALARAPVTVQPQWHWWPLAQVFSTEVESQEASNATATATTATFDTTSRYKEKPWEYLTSEEYLETYGERPVWANYRRNHKGGIPPQKTRKTCIVSLAPWRWRAGTLYSVLETDLIPDKCSPQRRKDLWKSLPHLQRPETGPTPSEREAPGAVHLSLHWRDPAPHAHRCVYEAAEEADGRHRQGSRFWVVGLSCTLC
ncbi:small ribosomal subunit protein mS40 isoform X2 [Lissotriton helveticus]